MPASRLLLSAFAFSVSGLVLGQPCSIDLGADHTICQNQQTTLYGPPGYSNYLWSPGPMTQDITVGGAGTYWCQVSYPSGNLVTNGNFSAGNTGFSSEFTYASDLQPEGTYNVGTNPASYHPQFSGSGTGNFLIANAGFNSYSAGQWKIWCQDVTVCPEQTYTLSFRARTLTSTNPARLQWWVSGFDVGPQVTLPAQAAGWATFNTSWTSGVGQTSATICLRVLSGDGVGNDFGLDDISLNGTIVLRDYIDVIVNPLPVVNCGGPYGPRCINGAAIALNGSPAGGAWSGTGVASSSFNPATAGAGTHTLTYSYTDGNGCTNSCTTNITVNALPVVICGAYGPVCVNGPSLALGGFPVGGTWSGSGVTGSTFNPATAGVGTHAVTYTYTNLNGCTNSCSTNITVNGLPVLNCGSYGPMCVNAAAIVLGGTPAGGTWSGPGVAGGSFDPAVAGAGTHAVTYSVTAANGCTNTCSTNITVNALPVLNCGSYGPLCVNAAAIALGGMPAGGTWSGTGVSAGAFDPATAGVGMHSVTYAYTDANGCSNTCSTNITVSALPVVNCGSYGPLCVNTSAIVLGGAPAGGTWSGPGVSGGSFDPAVAGAGIHAVTYSFTDGSGCTNTCNTNITVNGLPVLNCGSYGPLCVNAAAIALGGAPAGGTWSGPGVASGSFDPAVAGAGTHAVTYSFTDGNGCTNTCSTNITVNALPVLNCGSYGPLCVNAAAITLGGMPAGGTWSGTGVSAGAFDPATAGVGTHSVTYAYTDANDCSNTCSTSIIVNALPVVNCGSYGPLCVNTSAIVLGGAPAGGTWSGPGVAGGSFDPALAGAGTHAVTYSFTDGSGCTNTCSTNITVNGLPVLNCGSYGPMCVDAAAIALGGAPAGGTWSGPGIAGGSFDPAAAGVGMHAVTYSFTDGSGCTNTCSTNITVNGLPVVVPGNYGPLCAGDAPLALGGAPAGGTWSGPGTNAGFFDPAAAGIGPHVLTYAFTDANGCSQSAPTNIVVNPAPAVDLGNDTTVCPGQPVAFSAFWPGATYLWQDASLLSTYATTTPGTVTVQVTAGGCTTISSVDVFNFNLQSVNLGPDTASCAGDPVTLSLNIPGATYLWSTGSPNNSIDADETDWYWVDASLNGCGVRDSVYVTIHPIPSVYLGLDRMVCPGGTALLNATTPNATYLWSNSAETPTVNATPGPWTVEVTVNGCSGTDQVNVGTWTPPTVELGADTTLCPGAELVLDASTPFMTYLWQDNSDSAAFIVDQPGTYSVTLTDSHNCTGSDQIDVAYATPLPVFIGNDTTICSGTTLILDATTPGATLYSWNNGWNSTTLPVAGGGLYWVDVVQGDCIVTDSIHVTMAPLPDVDLGNDTTLCPDATLLLDVTSSDVAYLWQDNSILSTLLVSTAGPYSVTLTDDNYCAGRDTIVVTYAYPDALDLGADTTICDGASLTLSALLPGSTYLWNTFEETAAITVTDAGTYSVVAMQSGCSVTDEIDVAVAPSPTVDLGNDTTLCDGATLALTAFYPGATYLWSTSSDASAIMVSAAGPYGVMVDLDGCTASDDIEVAYVGALSLDLGNDTVLCPGATLDLHASVPGGTTVWSTNVVGPSITADEADIYWATITVSGCAVTDSIDVAYVPLDQLDLGDDAAVCDGDAMSFDISVPGAAYLWDDGTTEPTRSIDEEGEYWARISLGGCQTSDTLNLSITPLPMVDLGVDTGLCASNTMLLDATLSGATYLWNTNSEDPAITVGPGDWHVEVTLNGCSASDTIAIAALATPSISLPDDTTLCTGAVWMIDVAQANASYVWQDGTLNSGYLVDAAGPYGVTVTIGTCSVFDQVQVSYFDASLVDLGPDTTLCPGDELLLVLALPGATLTWPDGSHGTSFTVTEGGNYTVLANANGCEATDAIDVSYTPLPIPHLGDDRTLCEGDSVVLVVQPATASVIWNTGSPNDSILVTTTGTYSATLTLDGCTASDALVIEFIPVVDSIDLGPDGTICLGQTLLLDATTFRASYDWNTGDDDPEIQVTMPGLYIVHLSGPCIHAVDSMLITEGDCAPDVFTPNGFTPNGDGINETFAPITSGNIDNYLFLIFDRWGERIFESTTPGQPWDGTLNGTPAQDGVYVWQLAYRAVSDEGVTQKRLIGSVTLLR